MMSTDYSDDPLRNTAWMVFSEVTMRLSFLRNTKLKHRLGLAPAEYEALTALAVADDGSLRMGVLADTLCYSPSRLSYVVTGLIDRKLVAKETSKSDGRGFVACITPAGRELWLEANQMERELFRKHFFSYLSETDQAEFARMMAPLEAHLPALRDINHRF